MDEEIRVPIYLMTGFLESGKTSFLKFTLQQDYFYIPEKTLLILCEEGEEEYEEELLAAANTVAEVVEREEDLTPERLAAMEIIHSPGRVVIEYNGMWRVSRLEEMRLPEGWGFVQHITTVDGSTFQMYLNNMKSLFMEMVRNADLVLFNRCDADDPMLAAYRRSIKVANQGAEIIFEDDEGEIDIFADAMPFDLDAPVIDIAPEDYGIWYVDAMDHPQKYNGKTIRYKGRVAKFRGGRRDRFLVGRVAMTCCADDTTFIGQVCISPDAPDLKAGDWVNVTARVAMQMQAAYGQPAPLLYVESLEPAEPMEDEMVYFN